jgi:hypothetical protein
MTWFIAEDITEDNTCFKSRHWVVDNAAYFKYSNACDDLNFPFYNTFLLSSVAGGYTTSYYTDRSCCHSYYYTTSP